jgi:hypothetical protein
LDPSGLFSIAGRRVTPTVEQVSNFAAGFGDAASIGLTARARILINGFDPANRCTASYGLGGIAGIADSLGAGFLGTSRAIAVANSELAVAPIVRGVSTQLTVDSRMAEATQAVEAAYAKDLGTWAGVELAGKLFGGAIAGPSDCC